MAEGRALNLAKQTARGRRRTPQGLHPRRKLSKRGPAQTTQNVPKAVLPLLLDGLRLHRGRKERGFVAQRRCLCLLEKKRRLLKSGQRSFEIFSHPSHQGVFKSNYDVAQGVHWTDDADLNALLESEDSKITHVEDLLTNSSTSISPQMGSTLTGWTTSILSFPVGP